MNKVINRQSLRLVLFPSLNHSSLGIDPAVNNIWDYLVSLPSHSPYRAVQRLICGNRYVRQVLKLSNKRNIITRKNNIEKLSQKKIWKYEYMLFICPSTSTGEMEISNI